MFEAYVLHSISYRETSLIVKCFTKEHGIVNLIANGAKRKKSQFAAILQPFTPLLIYWKHYSLDLATLYKAEASAAPYRLSGLYLFAALYINELLMRLLATHDPHIELFTFYKQFLENLISFNNLTNHSLIKNENTSNKIFLEEKLRFIEKKILKAIGYELQLDRDSKSGECIELDAEYYFDFEDGLKLYRLQLPKVSQITISGKSLLALHNDNFIDATELQEAKLFMRKILSNVLGNKPLATRKLFV